MQKQNNINQSFDMSTGSDLNLMQHLNSQSRKVSVTDEQDGYGQDKSKRTTIFNGLKNYQFKNQYAHVMNSAKLSSMLSPHSTDVSNMRAIQDYEQSYVPVD